MSSHERNLKVVNDSVRTRGTIRASQYCHMSRVSEGTDVVHVEPESRGSRDMISNESFISCVVDSVKVTMPACAFSEHSATGFSDE